MKNRRMKALLIAVLLCFPLCAYAEGEGAVVQNEPDTVWVRQYHTDWVTDVVFCADGSRIATVGLDSKLNIITTATGEMLFPILPPTRQFKLVSGKDNDRLYSCGIGANIYCWNMSTGSLDRTYETLHQLGSTAVGLSDICISSDGRYLGSCGFHEAIVTDIESGKEVLHFNIESDRQGDAISFSPDGSRIAVVSQPGWIYIVDIQSSKVINSRAVAYVIKGGIKYSPDGRYLIVGGLTEKDADYVLLLDANTLQQKHHWDTEGTINDVAFSPSGNYALSASQDGYIRIWNIDSGELVRKYFYIGPFGIPLGQRCVAVSPNSNLIASALVDDRTYLWNAHWSPATGVEEQPSALQSSTVVADIANNLLHIYFDLTRPTTVGLEIVDLQGRTLITETDMYSMGIHEKSILTSLLAQGAYFCRLTAGENTIVQPFTITR